MKDPTTDEERKVTAGKCAASLDLDVPMAVDGVDDAVALAYNAWPERIYIIRPDGRIHYKSGLGPFGFKPDEAAKSLAKLTGVNPPEPESEDAETEPAERFEDDGFSGIWAGKGQGRITRGETAPFRLFVRLGQDGTVGGRFEAGRSRTRVLLADATFDRETGKLDAKACLLYTSDAADDLLQV